MRSVFLVYILNDRNNNKEIWSSVFYIQRCSIFSKISFAVKITDVNSDVSKFIPISAVESFVLFPFTGDYLNLEMFKIFYLLGV